MPGDDLQIIVKSVHDLTDEEIGSGTDLGNILSAEILPDDPPSPVEQNIAGIRALPARVKRWSIRAYAGDGTLVGVTGFGYDPEHQDNPDIAWTNVAVHPDHRRQGIGTALLAELTRLVIAEGKTRYVGGCSDLVEGGPAFAKSLGAAAKQAEHINHVPIAEADREMLERWRAEGPDRAPGYELITWDGPCPEEHADAFVDLALVMNTAPRDDLEMNDWTWSVKEMREGEDRMAAVGCEVWTVVARRIEDGALAGFHDLSWMPSDPNTMWVGSTGVRPEHRGHALGKWLKAAMMLRVMDERPQVTSIRTGNADSNDAMLGINKQMGYRPLIAYTTWEVPVADVATWLEARGHSVG